MIQTSITFFITFICNIIIRLIIFNTVNINRIITYYWFIIIRLISY